MGIFSCLQLFLLVMPSVANAGPVLFSQLSADLNQFIALGSQYFNTSSCVIPSNVSLVPVVLINSVNDLLNIGSYRKGYKSNELVYFQLTGVDSTNSSGFFQPAYLLHTKLNLFANMSCSYVRGLGREITSILVDYPNITTANNALNIFSAHDLIIADLTIDRTNASWWNPGYQCSIAANYPNLIPNGNAANVLSTAACVGFFSHHLNLNLPSKTNHAIKVVSMICIRISPSIT